MKNPKPYVFCLLCFFSGMAVLTVVTNYVCARELVNHRMLFEAFWRNLELVPSEGNLPAIRILMVRILETLFVAWLGRFRQRGGELLLFLCFLGAVTGMLASWFTWNTGALGVLVFLMLVLPHTCFYGVAWLLLLVRNQYGSNIRQFRLWIVTVAVMALGIWSELVIHPFLIRMVCKMVL